MAFIFHNIWVVILPIDEFIFFKIVIAPPTSYHQPVEMGNSWPALSQTNQKPQIEGVTLSLGVFSQFSRGYIDIYIYMRKTITSSMFGNRFSISHPNPRRQHLHGCGPRSNPVHFQRQYQGQRVERRPTGLGKVTRQFFRAWWCAVSWRISWWV